MRTAARYLPGTPTRPGDGALTSSVRGGPIGVNRIDLPATKILLAGRGLRDADPHLLREAVAVGNPWRSGGLRVLTGDTGSRSACSTWPLSPTRSGGRAGDAVR
jgi:hypothetical protein